MAGHQIIDTFPTFLYYWEEVRDEPLDVQVDQWLKRSAAQWPEIAEKYRESYADDGLDWRVVLKERVFPLLPERLPRMMEVRRELLERLVPIYQEAQRALGRDFDAVFVILAIGYVGWVVEYRGQHTCLLGLSHIVGTGYAGQALSALVAHEVGHLAHRGWRARHGLVAGEGPCWDVYEEGFAQRCEHLTMGQDTWHAGHGQENWLTWCCEHKSWLAQEFLQTIDAGESANDFLDAWQYIGGYHACGYFLGHEVIREWEEHAEMEDIAVLSVQEVDDRVRETLEKMASSGE